ncbi:hypothetical protein ACIBQX_32225 [Nonomuraea sp. NPDC049714]|uniref:hypothetical protein n=1 Tax=Nonomuraea sp. NPDC049714 TaxID=3364357 RepID=UPI00378AB735
MTHPARVMLDRLRAIDWSDMDRAFDQANSRALLMREYLRRAALWARHCGAGGWPFFAISQHVEPADRLPGDVAADLEEFMLSGVGPRSIATTCRDAVNWAALPSETKAGLPDPYEPLLTLYERGGGFFIEEFIDLNGVMIRLGTVESNAAATPFLTLASATLDALDAEGEITYYAKVGNGYPRAQPRGIVRRRLLDGRTCDEAFTRNLRWERTEYLRRYDFGHNDVGHVAISEVEAAIFMESVTNELTGKE